MRSPRQFIRAQQPAKVFGQTGATTPVNLIAGLLVRVSVPSGARFRVATGELNAFLVQAGEEALES